MWTSLILIAGLFGWTKSSSVLNFASSLAHFRYSYIIYDFSCLGVLWQFPSICVYVQHKYVSIPCAELSLVRLADSPLVDPFTEQPLAGVSGIFKTQFPKDSLNFWFKVIILHFQQRHTHPGLSVGLCLCVCWPAARPREVADHHFLQPKCFQWFKEQNLLEKALLLSCKEESFRREKRQIFGLLPSLQREGFQACVSPMG